MAESDESQRPTTQPTAAVGDLVEVTLDRPAHGGHCVGRVAGRVIFVRYGLPGERVVAELTDVPKKGSFWRADVVDVLEASPERVESAWPAAGRGGVGGAELSHVSLPGQLRWKSAVVTEQLQRLGGVEWAVEVQPAPGDDARGGLGYRTRVEFIADAQGRAGMRAFHSHDVIALQDMPLARPELAALDVFSRAFPPRATMQAITPASLDRPLLLVNGVPWQRSGADRRPSARTSVRETVALSLPAGPREFEFRVAGSGFWQVHDQAPTLLAQAVVDTVVAYLGDDLEGALVADLYCGAGLFTVPLSELVGPTGVVIGVESDGTAIRDALRNTAGRPWVHLVTSPVLSALAASDMPHELDVVVLDPPRAGAGSAVVHAVCAKQPRVVVYIACDPAALGRDVATLRECGYDLADVQAWDIFPHTHHVETMAVFVPREPLVSLY